MLQNTNRSNTLKIIKKIWWIDYGHWINNPQVVVRIPSRQSVNTGGHLMSHFQTLLNQLRQRLRRRFFEVVIGWSKLTWKCETVSFTKCWVPKLVLCLHKTAWKFQPIWWRLKRCSLESKFIWDFDVVSMEKSTIFTFCFVKNQNLNRITPYPRFL